MNADQTVFSNRVLAGTAFIRVYQWWMSVLRQMECELRAFANCTFDANVAPMGMQDTARDGQPETCSAAAALAIQSTRGTLHSG